MAGDDSGAARSPNAMLFPAKQGICPGAHPDLCLATIPPGGRSGGWDRSIWEERIPSGRSWRAWPSTSSCCSEDCVISSPSALLNLLIRVECHEFRTCGLPDCVYLAGSDGAVLEFAYFVSAPIRLIASLLMNSSNRNAMKNNAQMNTMRGAPINACRFSIQLNLLVSQML